MIKVFQSHESHRQELDDGGYERKYFSYFRAVRCVAAGEWEGIGETRKAQSLIKAAQVILGLPDPAPGRLDRDETGFLTLPRGIKWGPYWVRLESSGRGTGRKEWLALYTPEEWERQRAAEAAEAARARRREEQERRTGRAAPGSRRVRPPHSDRSQEAAEFVDTVAAQLARSRRRKTCPFCGAEGAPGDHICDIPEE